MASIALDGGKGSRHPVTRADSESDGGGRWIGCFSSCLRRLSGGGHFRVTTSRGTVFTFGDGTGQPVSVRFTSRARRMGNPARSRAQVRRSLHGRHVRGRSKARSPTCSPLRSAKSPKSRTGRGRRGWLRYLRRRLTQFNPRPRARRNVAHHYDLDGRLYSLFLDADRQYSCGYFEKPGQSLDDAQLAKKRHLAAKLMLEPETSACSTSAAAGAGSASISPKSAAPMSPALRFRKSSTRSPTNARLKKGSTESRPLPAAGLSRCHRPLRPHRVGWNV